MFYFKNGYTTKRIKDILRNDFKGRAVSESGDCQYLTSDGKKCAVGLFIPKGHEGEDSERDAFGLLDEHPDLLDYMPLNTPKLRELQVYHDDILDSKSSIEKQRVMLYRKILELAK